jgi:hypothetical protein
MGAFGFRNLRSHEEFVQDQYAATGHLCLRISARRTRSSSVSGRAPRRLSTVLKQIPTARESIQKKSPIKLKMSALNPIKRLQTPQRRA